MSLLRCSKTSDLLDEFGHLIFLNGSTVVSVELSEASIEVLLTEDPLVVHLFQGIGHKLLGLLPVELSTVVFVILTPDVVYALAYHCINVCHLYFAVY